MAEPIAIIRVCTDCMFVHANGETGNEQPDCEPWGLLPTADVAMGDTEDHYFSWSECPACGTFLGGDRYLMAVFSWDRNAS